jgi:hypothetical protein
MHCLRKVAAWKVLDFLQKPASIVDAKSMFFFYYYLE